jgi:hypothetical protein
LRGRTVSILISGTSVPSDPDLNCSLFDSLGYISNQNATSADPDQTAWMCRLIYTGSTRVKVCVYVEERDRLTRPRFTDILLTNVEFYDCKQSMTVYISESYT